MPTEDEYKTALGDIILNWSYLDSAVEIAIWGLAELEVRYGLALTTNMGV